MKKTKFCGISVLLLFASAIPAFGYASSAGPKSWFHHKHGGSASVGNHHAAKHPKPHHASSSHR